METGEIDCVSKDSGVKAGALNMSAAATTTPPLTAHLGTVLANLALVLSASSVNLVNIYN